ncbi:nucleotide exchange factor GrpE [Jonesia quinghaiensis]|uniref:nucleotide exchange factor GrpE n=1 Tax=Jonesia quinghaiensis TaxID=262806 RepID=UPI00041D4160|nr:nucleotide exchange factor GrpE [Jonesia quinghaiensis]
MSTENPRPEDNSPQDGPDSIEHLDFEPDAAEQDAGDAEPDAVLTDLEKAQTEAASHLADLQRLNAEYVNYTKRAKREQEAARHRGTEDVLMGLLPVLDDVARARTAGDLTGPFVAIAEKLDSVLTRFGVSAYGEVGEEFDPAVHEALMHQTSPDATSTTVTHVIEVGYRIEDKVVRAARVAVTGPENA